MGQEHNASATAFGTAYIEGDESVICHNERAQTCHNQFLSVRKRVLLARQGNNVCGIRNRHASSSYCYNYFSKLLLTLTVKLPHLKDTKTIVYCSPYCTITVLEMCQLLFSAPVSHCIDCDILRRRCMPESHYNTPKLCSIFSQTMALAQSIHTPDLVST